MKSILLALGYIIFSTTFLYVSLKALIFSTMSNSFPNIPFVIIGILMIMITVTVGLFLRRFANDSKNLMLVLTVISWILVLFLFWHF
ncbi:hypothetical protein C3943_10505 [Lysinibacillus sp. B2A1]|nr:hypothetical protein C3943_10505 [Lysinibacillus sp. B2A1]